MMMIHKAWTMACGNADDMRKMADDMDKMDGSIAMAYVDKTGMTQDEIIAIMETETWLTAEDAVKQGFADEIEETKKLAASIDGAFLMLNSQKFELKNYKNFKAEQIEPYRAVTPEPVVIDFSEQNKHFRDTRLKLLNI